MKNKIRIGSVIMVCGDFGQTEPREAIITCIDEEGKNGKTVIDYYYKDDESDCRWAYLYQIDEVISY